MVIRENYSLKNHNTFGIDVLAKIYVEFYESNDIKKYIEENNINVKDIFILGSGSNVLFVNEFKGTIFHSKIFGINKYNEDEDLVYLEIGSGIIWDDFVKYSVENNYYGIENLALIPGTVGAAPIQNIGAYGVEFEEVFEELEGFNITNKTFEIYSKDECKFGYRDSIFKNELKNNFIVTKVKIKLKKKSSLKTSYRAIQEYIQENKITDLDLKKLSDIVRQIRISKLPDPNKIGNAGSFFKNPIIDEQTFLELKNEFKDLVFFEIENNQYKIPAGWLIEKAQFKGKRFGNVGVHEKQALVLVNYGNATGMEIFNLANKIKTKILEKFNIVLETEVNIVH